jgi:hypothetical protein
LADGLASEVQPETQAYAKIISGDLALQRGNKSEAINMFTGANQLVDTDWATSTGTRVSEADVRRGGFRA